MPLSPTDPSLIAAARGLLMDLPEDPHKARAFIARELRRWHDRGGDAKAAEARAALSSVLRPHEADALAVYHNARSAGASGPEAAARALPEAS